jgi:sugar transferase (PEP-CTERM/EpsH1 system associated)
MGEILFLAHRIPWPADRGDKIRSYNILRHLAEMAPVHVGAFADDDRDMGFVPNIEPLFASVHVELRDKPQWRSGIEALCKGAPISVTSFASDSMQAYVNAQIASGRISHIFVFSGQMAQFVPADFKGRVVTDFVDVDSAKFASYAKSGNPMMRWIHKREAKKLSDFEQSAARRADVALLVSEAEAAIFRSDGKLGPDRVRAISNGIDTIFYDPNGDIELPKRVVHGPMIVFTGQMDYRPNIEAVIQFAHGAFNQIRARNDKAVFAIVGRNPTPAVMALRKLPNVVVTGSVDDVRSWLTAADVVVAPLRIARGIQNKVLEAMAMAKPVVVSVAAAEGINAMDGQHFIIADDDQEQADAINALLADKASRLELGKAARSHVVNQYGWAKQLQTMDAIMQLRPILAEAAE